MRPDEAEQELCECPCPHCRRGGCRCYSQTPVYSLAQSGDYESVVSLAEAAGHLGVDPGTLRVQIHNGKLKARKVGPVWTVTPREVERYRKESLRGIPDR